MLCGISVEKLSTWFVNKRQRLWKGRRSVVPTQPRKRHRGSTSNIEDGQLRVLYSCSMPLNKSQMKGVLNSVNQYWGIGRPHPAGNGAWAD